MPETILEEPFVLPTVRQKKNAMAVKPGKTLKPSKKSHFWDIWWSAIVHGSSTFFRKCGFWGIIGQQFLRTQGCRFGAVLLQGNRRPIMLQEPHFLKKVELPWTIALHQMSQKSDFLKGLKVFPT